MHINEKKDNRPEFMCGANNPKNGLVWPLELLLIIAIVAGDFFFLIFGNIFISQFLYYMFGSNEFFSMISNNLAYIFSIAFVILVGGLVLSKRKPASFGLVSHGALKSLIKGILAGIISVSVVILAGIITGSFKLSAFLDNIDWTIWIILVISGFILALGDQIIFNGYIIPQFSRRYSLLSACIVSIVLSSMENLINGWPGWIIMTNTVLFRIFTLLLFLYFENIWGAAAFQFAWNISLNSVYGTALSGWPVSESIMVLQPVTGHELINGGAYGPEGGLAVTAISVILIVLEIVLYRRKKSLDLSTLNTERGIID